MSAVTQWPPKDPEERIPVVFDMKAEMAASDALATAEITVEAVVAGVDGAPAILDGAPALAGKTATQWIKDGVDGASYRIKCKTTTNDGRRLVKRAVLPVRTETE